MTEPPSQKRLASLVQYLLNVLISNALLLLFKISYPSSVVSHKDVNAVFWATLQSHVC